jgi:UDPglucose 6-dehydrogenase
VGGHCLPKDGILLLWRKIEAGADTAASLILEARRINDESPAAVARHAEKVFGDLSGKSLALLGAAYRANSEDTRNSPALALARHLLDKGCRLIVHDPYVRPADQNLARLGLEKIFTRELPQALSRAEIIVFGTAHQQYVRDFDSIVGSAAHLQGVYDGCHLIPKHRRRGLRIKYAGLGQGKTPPSPEFIDFVYQGFRAVETGFANELKAFIDFANERYAIGEFDRVDFRQVQNLAETCVTGCRIVSPGPVKAVPAYRQFLPRLVKCAVMASP